MTASKRKRRDSGSSIVEVALLAPWIFFLFVGIFDFGFYTYAAICTQNAARAVALAAAQTATSGITGCSAALGELKMLPNIGYNPSSSLCAPVTIAPATTTAVPVNVCVGTLNGATATAVCGLPASKCADNIGSGAADALASTTCQFAVVTYQDIPLVPIPGLLTGRLTLSRTAEVRQTTP